MVKKLTVKMWVSTGLLLLVCLALSVPLLWWYGPSAVRMLGGAEPPLGESVSNIYGGSAIGLFMLVICVAIFVKQLVNSVSKGVNLYLQKHSDVTMEHLDHAFASARKVGNMWIGGRWTFSHELRNKVIENAEITRVYSQTERSRRQTNYYLCLELADGKKEVVKMDYRDLTEMMESYRKDPHIQVANNP